MSVIEFKNCVKLIMNFVSKVNSETISGDIKRTMVKLYASSLKINLSDNMVDSIFKTADVGEYY